MYTDTRPRHKYQLPDGRVIPVIRDHDDVPDLLITFEVTSDDALWEQAQRALGSTRRVVLARLVEGL